MLEKNLVIDFIRYHYAGADVTAKEAETFMRVRWGITIPIHVFNEMLEFIHEHDMGCFVGFDNDINDKYFIFERRL